MKKSSNPILKRSNQLSKEFLQKLAEISAGYLPVEVLDKLLKNIQQEAAKHYFTRSSESNFLRIVEAMFDKYSFLNDCAKYPHYIEIITSISTNSNYLTDILVRSPEYFYWIVNPSILEPKLTIEEFEKSFNSAINCYKTLSAKVNYFRILKKKEILRIGLRDILGIAELEEVTEEISIVAKVITSKLFELCVEEIKSKYRIKDLKSEYCLIALGKLGGNELNYSSDIDLIAFYDEEVVIKNKSTSELLTEAIKLFIEYSSSITSAGFIFRVDFRLRPDGRNSPLCRSINEYLTYYESRGEDWERQMLIKAGFIAGSSALYNRFMNYLTAFIYPSSFSVSPTEQIKKLKKNIEQNLGEAENIKLQPGGIRDIEFSVQALQLLNGGKWKELRTGNTLQAICALKNKKLLSEYEANQLISSYKFYRRIEHYLQLMNDKQTHTIPSDIEMQNKLSCYLGFKSLKQFMESLKANRERVLNIYNSIMGTDVKVKLNIDISDIHFENIKKATQDFNFLRNGKGLLGQKEFDERTISLFQNIEPKLITYLKHSIDPDSTLQNFVRVIKHSNFPNIWYKELNEPKFLKSFLNICEYSQKAVNLFSEDDELKECFLDRSCFDKLDIKDIIKKPLKKILFSLAVQYILGLIDQESLSSLISIYCKKKMHLIIEKLLKKPSLSGKYFIAALGSCGTNEMTFSSDIDLIFVVDKLKSFNNAEKKFQNILQQIRSELLPFKIDCRLRPEGKSSNLVWEIDSYDDYIQRRLRIWELQAFTKMSFVCGDEELYNNFIDILQKRLVKESIENIKSEISSMRKKLYPSTNGSSLNLLNLKKSQGGLIDVEFALQLLILSEPERFYRMAGKSQFQIINYFKENSDLEDLDSLQNNYRFLKKLILLNQICFDSTTEILPTDKKKLNLLSKQMGIENSEKFRSRLNETLRTNKLIFQKIVAKN